MRTKTQSPLSGYMGKAEGLLELGAVRAPRPTVTHENKDPLTSPWVPGEG